MPNNYLIIFGLTLALGVVYNALVAWLHQCRRKDGYTSFLVVGGVTGTLLLSIFVVGLLDVALIMGLFIASGLPMIIGDMMRYTDEREKRNETLREILGEDGAIRSSKDGKQEETMADKESGRTKGDNQDHT